MTVWYAGWNEFRPAYQTVIYKLAQLAGYSLFRIHEKENRRVRGVFKKMHFPFYNYEYQLH